MTFFYKIVKNPAPKYLQSYLLPQAMNQYSTRVAKKNLLTALASRTLSFSNTFFPHCINVWNKLNHNLRNANSIYKFKNYLTKFVKVKENFTWLYVLFHSFHFADLRGGGWKEREGWCFWGGVDTPVHTMLVQSSFLNRSFKINFEFRNMNDSTLTFLVLFGSEEQNFDVNAKILNLTVLFFKKTGRFHDPLIWMWWAIRVNVLWDVLVLKNKILMSTLRF